MAIKTAADSANAPVEEKRADVATFELSPEEYASSLERHRNWNRDVKAGTSSES